MVDMHAVSSVCSGVSKCESRTSQELDGFIVSENCNQCKEHQEVWQQVGAVL